MFSIVIACHNHEAFIRKAVDSALSQRHPGKEIIAVDDGSGDGSAEILRSYGKSIVFAGLPENRGAGSARNHGASLARGKYLVFLDGDDVLMPWALDVYDRLITACQPELILAKCARVVGEIPAVAPEGIPHNIQFVTYPNFLSKDRPWVYNTSSFIVHRSTFQSAGGWSPDIFYQDIQDLLNKLAIAGTTALVLAPATVWYRIHSTNAIRRITPFVEGIHVLKAKAKAGVYPGGLVARWRRNAWFGGLIFYWAKEALRSGLYWDAFKVLLSDGWLVVFGTLQRSAAWLGGRRPTLTLPLDLNGGSRLDSTPERVQP